MSVPGSIPRIILKGFCKRVLYFYRLMRLNKNIKIFLNYLLGPLLFIWLSGSIYNQVRHQPDLATSWIKIKQSMDSSKIWYLVLAVVLMFFNWSIEAIKWKISIQNIQPVHFFKSFSDSAKCNLNIKAEGENDHHKAEAIFKAIGRSIGTAARKTGHPGLPSTKGKL